MRQKREQAVRELAYTIWERDGRPEGRNLAHWLQAEVEIENGEVISVIEKRQRPASQPARGATKRRAHSVSGGERRVIS